MLLLTFTAVCINQDLFTLLTHFITELLNAELSEEIIATPGDTLYGKPTRSATFMNDWRTWQDEFRT
jgi:hypothetical protein